ncbi:hypothetical protein PHACT_07790 [Pseudohongiella acticola]|uniref:Cadherin domain-containing protein n=1 Tax=Pseudohongiella acticola TaxID=1524254 RepID=A0A1E8CKR6_9GAMM|nr:cadherin-like domain-containing protein [Pseudohongiella acticola]OFE13050.1 hypothetical protein PHACT_07790 [Pseudohongiella acticola]
MGKALIQSVIGRAVSILLAIAAPAALYAADPIEQNVSHETAPFWQGSLFLGQSFTANATGDLVTVSIRSNEAQTGTLTVLEGEGMSGTVLHTQNITYVESSSGSLDTITLNTPVAVTQDAVYTLKFKGHFNGHALHIARGNRYSGGVLYIGSDIFSTIDMTFAVQIADNPKVSSATYDRQTGQLAVTGVNFVANGAGDDVDTTKLTITGQGGSTHTLSNIAGVEITNATSFTVTLSGADKVAADTLLSRSGTSATDSTNYNLAFADDFITAVTDEDTSDASNTITVANPVVTLSTGSATVAENSGTSSITATLNLPSASPVTVNLAYSGTATSGTDYGAPSTSITVPAGQTSANAATGITATGDSVYEGDETIIVDISAVSGATEDGTQQQTITLTDAQTQPVVTLGTGASSISENGGSTTLTATLSHASVNNVIVNLAYSGTATSGTDYATPSSSITVSAGQTVANAATNIATINDTGYEGDETIIVDISSVSGGSESGSQRQTITITDDDNAPPVFNSFSGSLGSGLEDQAITVSFAALTAAGDESDQNGSVLAFIVKTVASGSLQIGGNPWSAIGNSVIHSAADAIWTPAQNANGTLNGFTVVAVDNQEAQSSTPVMAQFAVTSVNDSPVVTTNTTLTVNEGATATITNAALNATDADDNSADLSYSVTTASTNGRLELSTDAGVTINNFTQADIDANRLRYVHDGGETTADSFAFSLADGGEDGAQAATGVFTVTVNAVNDDPALSGLPTSITVTEDLAGNVDLSAATFTDVDAGANSISLSLTVAAGSLSASNAGGVTVSGSGTTSLTLNGSAANIDSFLNSVSSIQYTGAANANGNNATTLSVTANDAGNAGAGGGTNVALGSVAIHITAVNDGPSVAANTALPVNEGATATITNAALNITDVDDNSAGLTFSVTSVPANGRLELSTNAGVTINSFSQADIDANRLRYVHDGSETVSDSFGFSVADGGEDGTQAATGNFSLTVNPVNDTPAISGDPVLMVVVDTRYSFTPSATDAERDTLSFSIANKPSWATFDGNTGTLHGMPKSGDAETIRNITISVSDGTATVSLPAFDLLVIELEDDESGTTVNEVVSGNRVFTNPNVTPSGVIDGGFLAGQVTNNGLIRDVTLVSGTRIEGGALSGTIIGGGSTPALISNANITPGTKLENVVISANTTLGADVQLGSNVRFESLDNIPSGVELTGAMATLDWNNGDLRVVVDLQSSILTSANGNPDTSLIHSIQLPDGYAPDSYSVDQNADNGEIEVAANNMRSTLLPVRVSMADPDAEEGTFINDDGDIEFVTGSRRVVVSYPVLQDKSAFTAFLASFGLDSSYDTRANLVARPRAPAETAQQRGNGQVSALSANFYYMARPDVMAVAAEPGKAPGTYFEAVPGLAGATLITLVFADDNGKLMQQNVVPVPADWMLLKEGLTAMPDTSAIRIDPLGIISVSFPGQTVRGHSGFDVVRDAQHLAQPDQVVFQSAGDLNQDGNDDYWVIYPTGDRQALLIFP